MLATAPLRAVFDVSAAYVNLPPWGPYAPGVWLEMQCLQESEGNPVARHYDKDQDKGGIDSGNFEEWASYGLFQIEGRTFRQMLHLPPDVTIDFMDILGRPLLNLDIALRLHKENFSMVGGNVERALACYNGGPRGAVTKEDGTLVRQDYVEAVRSHGAAVLADRGIR